MKTEWDYTSLADAYLKRPGYSKIAISKMLSIVNIKEKNNVCDIGAGAAHLTIELAKKNLMVYAIEPNDKMRKNGIGRTKDYRNVFWYDGIGEDTKMKSDFFDLVTFGSSFNVCDRKKALIETYRILKKKSWFACIWNHRDLSDELQKEIEEIIKYYIPDYEYGTRRENQTEIIIESGLFDNVECITQPIIHEILAEDFIEGWKSHGTVYRQGWKKFDKIMQDIRKVVIYNKQEYIKVPYNTKIWIAQSKKWVG